MCRIQLEVERRRLDGLLLISRESGETGGKRIGNTELHQLPM